MGPQDWHSTLDTLRKVLGPPPGPWRSCHAGQPYLDAGIAQCLQRGPDVGLQLVLHARQAQQLHLHLQALNHRGHLQRAVVHAQLGLDVAGLGGGESRL